MDNKEKQGFILEHIMPPMMKFLNTRAVTAIKNGMMYPMPFIIVGSVFLILGQLPYQPAQDWLFEIGLGQLFLHLNDSSFGIMALFAVFGIAYSWVKDAGYEGIPAGLLAVIVNIILQPASIATVTSISDSSKTSTDWQVSGIIDRQWLGGKGMILAILVGLFVGWIYTWFLKKEITIKLPEQVPTNVSESFTALIPAAAIITIFGAISGFFSIVMNITFVEWVYEIIQRPLQNITDGPVGLLIIAFLPVFIWWFGMHGTVIISGIMTGILTANSVDNAALFQSGELTLDNGANIITQAFMDQFITVTGTGMTLGFVIFMVFRAKSETMKSIGKLAIGPAVFNINEPVLFGLPVVLNPLMAIPFMFAPVVSAVLTYIAIYMQIIPPFNGAAVPWTTPPVLSGLLVGGWKTALWQILMLVITGLIYIPFAIRYDKVLLADEVKREKSEV